MHLCQYIDYRKYLRNELERRLEKNPTYSLRAFARHLGLTPQMLSFVLNHKKNISTNMAAQISERLNLNPEESTHFLDLVILSKAKNSIAKSVLKERLVEHESLRDFGLIEASKFKAIADWHHYGILELTQTKGFRSDPVWIAKRLGIKSFEVQQAIERLKMLGLLYEDAKGNLLRTDLNLTATYRAPNAALRKLAKQYLEKAIAALECQAMEERDITNITMSIDPARLPQAKKMIADFRRKLCAYLEQGERTEVYTFSPSLIKITKSIKEN